MLSLASNKNCIKRFFIRKIFGLVLFGGLVFAGCNNTDGFMTDSQGNKYKTIKIGAQEWMAENIKTKTLSESWCYNNIDSNCSHYGRLYSWKSATTICPEGWHLPSLTEFSELTNTVGGEGFNAYEALSENGNSGFKTSLGGFRTSQNTYSSISYFSFLWSSTPKDSLYAWSMVHMAYSHKTYLYGSDKAMGLAVRCLKNSYLTKIR